MPYSEDIDAYTITDKNGEQNGTRVFFDDDDGPNAALPIFGDSFPDITGAENSFEDCTVRSVTFKKWKRQASKTQYAFRYTNGKLSPSTQDSDTDFEDLARNYSSSGQMVTLGGSPTFSVTGNELKGKPFTKFLPTITLTIQKNFISETTMKARVKAAIGRVNSDTFEGEVTGFWLFNGFRAEEVLNKDEEREWQGHFSFEYRAILWNHEWDVTAQAWAALDVNKYDTAKFGIDSGVAGTGLLEGGG